jgi:K+/H+ antiporter YhaU regulatory subunit KhtT
MNQSIINSRFWHETGATIIGIKRDGQLIISPNPDEILKEEDVIVAIK